MSRWRRLIRYLRRPVLRIRISVRVEPYNEEQQ